MRSTSQPEAAPRKETPAANGVRANPLATGLKLARTMGMGWIAYRIGYAAKHRLGVVPRPLAPWGGNRRPLGALVPPGLPAHPRHIECHVAGTARTLLRLAHMHHRYRRLRRNTRGVAVPVAVQHQVADD